MSALYRPSAMSTIQAAMAQLLSAERQACEGRELLSLNAAISRTLLTIEPPCHLACELRKMQINIRRHILAALVEEGTSDTAQQPSQHETSFEYRLPHPDTIVQSVERELHYNLDRISSPTVNGAPDERPERRRCPTAAIMTRADEPPMAKKRPADNEFGSVAKHPKTWLSAITRGFFT